MVEVDDLMPPATVPKFNVSSKKRSRSGAVKIGPEPQLVISGFSSKDGPISETRPTPKTVSGRGTPEEEETQVGGEHEPSTPQDSTLGPLTEQEGEQL
ncbi:hypothetical protein FRX31_023544 [Thalictrum thalictroides]|uniref:Uncharacterized protein n=1 Tax=Thalictrum thalictroides TaxID=46969 RepID=A0A7J6VP31_THATH|nr:hypothetical protein FRX31_023544 [Thalictrum thalictroides]